MRRKSIKRMLSLTLGVAMTASALAGCGSSSESTTTDTTATTSAETTTTETAETVTTTAAETTETDSEPVVIRYGTHWKAGIDPYNVDDVTGEYTLGEAERQASIAALDKIKEELNVEFEFVQYSADTRTELMTSVLAGDPVCDIALIWGGAEGTILAQNVLQELDDYTYIFEDESVSWMLDGELYGHSYLLSSTERFYQRWPLIYNATLIEQVDTLKDEDGNTIYPTDLFLDGEWTWSTFQDYLSKINAYYANVESMDGCVYDTVQAYETDHRFAGLSAIYSNGGAIYGDNGLSVNTDETKEALEYLTNLMELGLMTDCGTYDDGYTPQWTTSQGDFSRSGTVFTECPDWLISSATSAVAERGESVGMVPWPRPDDVEMDDPSYQQVITLGDSVGVLKGVDEEKTELALKAFALYWKTYYEVYGGVDDITEYKSAMAASTASSIGLDIYNETYGDDILECFIWNSEHLSNDYADLLGLRTNWDDVLGKSLYGLEGMASYTVAIEENMNLFDNVISNMETILASDEVKDNISPELSSETIVVAAGTSQDDIDFTQYFTATDSVDGDLDLATATFEVSEDLDLATPGSYEKAVKMTIADLSGNEADKSATVVVYNADNTTEPTVTLVEAPESIVMDTDASSISWSGSFIESAVDADGLDVSGNITADLSTLDTTTPGDYEVTITVADYAGNETSVTVQVTVVSE